MARCCPGWCRYCSWTSLCPPCQNSACKVINKYNEHCCSKLIAGCLKFSEYPDQLIIMLLARVNGIWTFLETFSLQPNGSQAILACKRVVLNKYEINKINFIQEEEEQIFSQEVQLSKRIGHIGEVKEAWLLEHDWWTPHRNHFSVNVGGHQFYVRVPSKHCWWCWCSSSDGSKCDGLKMRLQRWRSEGCWWLVTWRRKWV